MNDHEIFVASFDYHYALRKLNELVKKTRIVRPCSLTSSAKQLKFLINIQIQSVTLPKPDGISRNGEFTATVEIASFF